LGGISLTVAAPNGTNTAARHGKVEGAREKCHAEPSPHWPFGIASSTPEHIWGATPGAHKLANLAVQMIAHRACLSHDGRGSHPVDNRSCWIVYFRRDVIVRVRAYLDSTMVTRLFEENPI
jgi:hypothetical protein